MTVRDDGPVKPLGGAGRCPVLAVSSPRVRAALEYWERKRAGRAMPMRRDLDPMEMIPFLPFVMLIDVLSDPPDFRYRLLGTEVVAISRRDWTGLRLSEIPDKGPGTVVWSNYETVVATRAPFSRVPPYVGPQDRMRGCENLLMPLSEDGECVSMIFQVIDYQLS